MSIELFHVIGNMSIYRICVIKFVILQYNSNILDFKKKKKKKKKLIAPMFGGLSMLGGLRPWPRPRAAPASDYETQMVF